MSTRSPGWRLAAGITAGAALYAAAGFWLSGNAAVEAWLYRIGLTVAAVAPLVFTAVYHLLTRGAVWRDEIGSRLAIAALTLVPVTAPLAYVFWFQGGRLTSTWLAWLEVSGPCVSALAWLALCSTWLRISRGKNPGGRNGSEPGKDTMP